MMQMILQLKLRAFVTRAERNLLKRKKRSFIQEKLHKMREVLFIDCI